MISKINLEEPETPSVKPDEAIEKLAGGIDEIW